jgi:hypothetical protein
MNKQEIFLNRISSGKAQEAQEMNICPKVIGLQNFNINTVG